MTRFRIAIRFFIVLMVCAFAVSISRAQSTRPDILIIMPDQMRGDCLSIAGHPVVRTPNLDALARQGAWFPHAYTTIPSCIPARHALLTGLFPKTSGMVGYKARPITYPTFPQMLKDAGYATVLVGREMHQLPAGEPYGYQKMILGSTYHSDDDYDDFLKAAVPGSKGIRALVKSLDINDNGWEANPWPLANKLHPTEWIVRQSRKIVADTPRDQPLFLTTSFYAPHSPLFPPKKYFDEYMKKKLPPAAHGDWVDWSEVPAPKKLSASHRVLLEGELLHRAEAGYFGLITHLDDQIGPLIKEFKKRSEKSHRPWIIVFITDHGELLGDHGYFRKCEPYEGSAHIPFIIAGSPELGYQSGLRSDQPVCLEDVMPTLLNLAGVPLPKLSDGADLAPVLRGSRQIIRPWLHLEHAPCYSKEQAFQALTDGHYKYIWRPLDGSEQLFNLDNDPREEHDLSKISAEQITLVKWRERLVKELANRPEGFSDGKKLIAGRPYPPLQEMLKKQPRG